MSWFLYIITEEFTDEDGSKSFPGDAGVGMCSMEAGIMEAPYGLMYVVPESYVNHQLKERKLKNPSAYAVREIIEDYYNKEEVIEISQDDDDFFLGNTAKRI